MSDQRHNASCFICRGIKLRPKGGAFFVGIADQKARYGTLLRAREGRASYRQSAFGVQQDIQQVSG